MVAARRKDADSTVPLGNVRRSDYDAAMSATRTQQRVPFFDLSAVHARVADGILEDVGSLLQSGAFTNGPQVAAFEEAFASYCGSTQCVGVASGLDALRLALVGLGLEPGEEVLVPAMTFAATFEAVSQAGGVPVPVDVSEEDNGMDPAAAAAAVGPRTRVLMPVHLYGRLADMAALGSFAESRDVEILEDACQAHGATRDSARAGTTGRAGAFSFYPAKNFGALGDAGALVTDDPELAGTMRALREHGQRRKYMHDLIGWTSRLDTIHAAALLRKLPHLDDWNAQRRAAADLYAQGLTGVGDLALPDVNDRGQVWHLFVVRTPDPEGLAGFLADRGIGTGRHYPEPPHLSDAYRHLGYIEGAFPVAERIAREAISLPIFPGITEAQVEYVVESIRAWFAGA
jgi:dTDP-4-amino-4,6-dideoxygalactose transaminase